MRTLRQVDSKKKLMSMSPLIAVRLLSNNNNEQVGAQKRSARFEQSHHVMRRLKSKPLLDESLLQQAKSYALFQSFVIIIITKSDLRVLF